MRCQPVIANTRAAAYWSEVAPAWLALEDQLEQISATPGRLAMERLDLEPGHHVVDLGCGSGLTTLHLAQRVGGHGMATGIDINAELLTRARRRAWQHGACNVMFTRADVQTHRFDAPHFDRAYSRFGLMFFADPVAAFANIRRALRPRGRLSFVTFQGPDANEWMLVPATAAMTVTDTAPAAPDPDRPDLFSLASPERIRSILAAAGLHDIEIVAHNDSVETPEHQIPDVAAARTRVGPVAASLRTADAETHAKVLAAIEEALRARLHDGVTRLTRGTLLVTATT
jgi:SAM-dependent methyltransferase